MHSPSQADLPIVENPFASLLIRVLLCITRKRGDDVHFVLSEKRSQIFLSLFV